MENVITLSKDFVCPVCNRFKTNKNPICSTCVAKYGLNRHSWPTRLKRIIPPPELEPLPEHKLQNFCETCPKCGRHKAKSYPLCKECREQEGYSSKTWSDETRAQVASYYRQINQSKRQQLAIDDLNRTTFRHSTGLKTRKYSELGLCGGMLVAYKPYQDENDNKAYRKANDISSASGRKTAASKLFDIFNDMLDGDYEDDETKERKEAMRKKMYSVLSETLTNRQHQVVSLLLQKGKQNLVAKELNISESAVSQHLGAILKKLEKKYKST